MTNEDTSNDPDPRRMIEAINHERLWRDTVVASARTAGNAEWAIGIADEVTAAWRERFVKK